MSKQNDFSGDWHGVYTYTSSAKPGTFESPYELKIYNIGNQVVMQSRPSDFGDYILLRLTQDGNILTGTWYEQTSPKGSYKGVAYYGGIQLILDKSGDKFVGKWVGLDRTDHIRSGDWTITRVTGKGKES